MTHDRAVQVAPHGGGLIRLLGRILGLAACGLGLAFVALMLASLATGQEPAHADALTQAPSEQAVPSAVRSADALVPDAMSPHAGGRVLTGLARLASTDDRRETMASALRADPFAVSAAASRRAAGATTPSVMAATPSPGSHRAPLDPGGDYGPHRGAPAPTSRSTTSHPSDPWDPRLPVLEDPARQIGCSNKVAGAVRRAGSPARRTDDHGAPAGPRRHEPSTAPAHPICTRTR
jgi:hypothetical protein